MNTFELTIVLSNGKKLVELVKTELDIEAFMEDLEGELVGEGKPGWRIIGGTVVFNQAVSAIQAEQF